MHYCLADVDSMHESRINSVDDWPSSKIKIGQNLKNLNSKCLNSKNNHRPLKCKFKTIMNCKSRTFAKNEMDKFLINKFLIESSSKIPFQSKFKNNFSLFTFILILLNLISNSVINAALLKSYSAPEECDWHFIRNPLINSQNNHNQSNLINPSISLHSASLINDPTLVSDAVAVTCKLRTINSLHSTEQPTNFSLIQTSRTASLKIVCDDLLILSSISNNSFTHLTDLKQLIIEKCKLAELPNSVFNGLTQLKQLTIRTLNNDWDSQLNIRSSLLFNNLKRLEQLDLSTNNLVSLPDDLFCDLHSLTFLNLSTNAFIDVSSIGFSSKLQRARQCKISSLTNLDLTGNRLKVLTDRGFGILSSLKQLTLHDNQISRAEEHGLNGLSGLNVLVLSNNELVALPPRFFQPVAQNLNELYLQNNSISVLPPGLFNNLLQLTILDLSHNEITSHWINSAAFNQLKQLNHLDLSFNKLTKLDSSTFSSLTQLQTLILKHNELEILSDQVFSPLINLNQLILSNNRLHRIESSTFTGLIALRSLSIDSNQLNYIHPLAFRNLSDLMELNCSSNRFETVPQSMNNLQLSSLDLSFNRLKDIKNTSYHGNDRLFHLNLEGNQIGNLSKGIFADLPGLRILNLAYNKISLIEQGSLDDVPTLHYLRLDGNKLTEINGLFSILNDLLFLNVSHNSITWFDYALIPMGLQLLDLSNNQIETLGNYYEVDLNLKLKTLDVSGNRIREIDSKSIPSSIEKVFLKNNLLKKIGSKTFSAKQNLTRVDLSSNYLTNLDQSSFQLSSNSGKLKKLFVEFYIRDNPLICDCNLDWLQRSSFLDETKLYPKFLDLDQVTCTLLFGTLEQQIQPRLLNQVQPNEFLCTYRSHCYALCTCCEFDACDCKMQCPLECNCYYDSSWNTNIVDCGGATSQRLPFNTTTSSLNNNNQLINQFTHRTIPSAIPMDSTELYLDGNDLPILSSHAFIGRKNLKILHLNNSNIQTIHNRTFNGLRALKILHLEYNQLTILFGYEFERLFDLNELYLSHNQLHTIANNTFSMLKNLKVLTLDHNHLVQFSIWTLIGNQQPQFIDPNNNLDNSLINQNYFTTSTIESNSGASSLIYLTIAQNLWSCDCEFTSKLLSIEPELQMSIIRDAASVNCYLNETYSLPLFNGQFNQSLCLREFPNLRDKLRNSSAFQRFQVEQYLPFALIGASSFLIVLFGVIALLIYRHEMSVWFYSKYGLRINQRNSSSVCREEDRLFDAYISYSKREESFVYQMIAPELEYGSPPFRLCLHYRDLPVTTELLTQAIVEAMHASRRTILLLTENFLQNEWSKYEFKHAHVEMLKTNRHKLIIILLGNITLKDVQDPDLKFWLKNATILQYGEKLFWEKLKFAMPDISTYGRKPIHEQTREMTVTMHI